MASQKINIGVEHWGQVLRLFLQHEVPPKIEICNISIGNPSIDIFFVFRGFFVCLFSTNVWCCITGLHSGEM